MRVVDDRLRGAEPLVGRGVGGDDPLPLLEDVVDDRPRDRHPLVGVGRPAPADGLGDELAVVVLQQDRAPVGADRLEDELEDLGQERVDVEDVADRLGRLVHDREVDQPVLEPAAGRRRAPAGRASPRPTGMLLRMAERSSGLALARAGRPGPSGRARAPAGPSLKSITVWPSWSRSPGLQRRLVDRLAVDERAVGRAEVDDPVRRRRPAGPRRAGGRPRCRGAGSGSSCPGPGPWDSDFSSNRLPWSAPWITNKEATVPFPLSSRRPSANSVVGPSRSRLSGGRSSVNRRAHPVDGSGSHRFPARRLSVRIDAR